MKLLVDEGHGGQVLLGQDVCSKDKLVKYGGLGFAHLLDNIAPRMVEAGISQDDVDRMLVTQPRRDADPRRATGARTALGCLQPQGLQPP